MTNQPYPKDRTGAGNDVPSVPDSSYGATGLATEAGNLSNLPKPGMGHPAEYSGIMTYAETAAVVAAGPDNIYGYNNAAGTTGPGGPGTFMPGPSNTQPTGPTPEMGNNANPGITMTGPTDHYAE